MRIYLLLFILLFSFISCKRDKTFPPLVENSDMLRNDSLKPFYHGVASGDPEEDRVIIWTRVTPETQVPEIEGTWEVAKDSTFQSIVNNGDFSTSPKQDYTVKIDVTKLEEGATYFYRFNALGATSQIGRTRTAAQNSSKLKLGVVSCSNYEWGYFNSYKHLAKEKDLQAVLHLGDYIYEYGTGTYGDTTIGRINIPRHEIITLTDYRDRYAQYHLDKDLQAVHASHPFINIWDDHEISNNSYTTGAQNHQADEGDYETRKNIAKQVFYEWLPIRESAKHFRDFDFGNMAELVMLDERLEGRTAPADSLTDPVLNEKNHKLLGDIQFEWLANKLMTSQAKWKIIGNQVIYSYLDWGFPGFHINLDSWDGYPYEQKQLASLIKQDSIQNIIFVTGDTHSSWAFEATNNPFEDYDAETGKGAFAVEFGVTSINSANSNESTATDSVIMHEKEIVNTSLNPHLKYANLRDHGYLILTLTDSTATADYKFVSTVKKPESTVRTDTTFVVQLGSPHLKGE